MKHIFKYCAVLCAAFGILTLAGCQNPLDLFQPKSETGVRITINSGGERTLYPTPGVPPVFSRYELEFAKDSEFKRYTMGGSESSVTITDLSSGEWIVRVTGYMTITATEYAVADGTSNITVTNGKFENVTITISSTPVQEGPPGFFSFSVTYPDSVNDVELFIYNIGENYSASIYNWNSQEDPQSSIYWYISSGYYMMTFLMNVHSNGSLYRTVAWTEVIHIAPGRETRAEKVFSDDDLTRFFTIGGPVNVTVAGNPVDFTEVFVYSDSARTILLGRSTVSQNNWQLLLPVFRQTTTLYFSIAAFLNDIEFHEDVGSFQVQDTNVGYTITRDLAAKRITGTANVRINGVPVNRAWVVVYDNTDGKEIGEVEVVNGNWEMWLGLEYVGKTFSIQVRVSDPAKGYNFLYNPVITFSPQDADVTDVPFINVDITTVKLSGTVNLTVNGSRPNWASIEVYKTVNPANPIDGNRSGWEAACSISSVNNFAWELSIPVSLAGTTLHFFIDGDGGPQNRAYSYYHGAYILPPSDTVRDLGNVAIVIE
jgi:hypothetical protein